MSKDARYVPFPLFLIADLPGNLNDVFDYGIFKFARTIEASDLNTVYRQVLYGYYRGKLTGILAGKIGKLVERDIFIPDEDYNGFSGDGREFAPDTGIDEFMEAGENNADFKETCIEYWQVHQAMSVLRINGSLDGIISSARKTQKKVDEWEKKWGKDVTVMMSIAMMFEYYKKPKSEYEIDLLKAFLGIKSILGNKQLVGTTKDYVLLRMTGARKKDLLPDLLGKPGIKQLHNKYSRRYQTDKLLSELVSRGFITGKLAFNRRIYVSTHYTIDELPEAIFELLSKNNSKIKRDKNSAIIS